MTSETAQARDTKPTLGEVQTTMPIALQLWTVRDHAERDMAGTLCEVARRGYSAVELAG